MNHHRQSWKGSAGEAVVNVAVGFGIAWAAWQFLINPLFGFEAPVSHGFLITCIFTAISLLRSFLIRRAYTLYADWRSK